MCFFTITMWLSDFKNLNKKNKYELACYSKVWNLQKLDFYLKIYRKNMQEVVFEFLTYSLI